VRYDRIVTLTTDFGLNDHYVGTMKGVILDVNPDAKIVDICHSVQAYDVLDGALTISQAYNYFPSDTVHVVVVDPGVGTARRPILVTTDRHKFLAPDNGVLSMVYDKEERISARHVTGEHYFLQPVSNTFHGRDIFARVAGYLSKGVEVDKFGDEITDFVRFAAPRPKSGPGGLHGIVLKVDKFGNLITNITPQDVPQLFQQNPPAFRISIGQQQVTRLATTYSDGAPSEVFALLGSTGFLEIAANRNPAAKLLNAQKGTEVTLSLNGAASAG
jgi:hypothetical protein